MNRLLTRSLAAALLLAGVSLMPACNGARDTALSMVGQNGDKGFMVKTLVRGDRNRKYALFVPLGYNKAAPTKYPTIIFLHGVGEGGSDSQANLKVGMAPFVADQASSFPFIVIFPQSPSGQWDPNSEAATDVIAILDEVAKTYPVDLDSVSLTGLSTGGFGTWAIGSKYRDRFAALVPMGSSASAFDEAPNLVNMPIRSYHNNGDWAAAMWNDDVMVNKVNSLGGHAQMFKTDGPGHNCWEIAYGETDLFTWLRQQHRRTTVSTPAAPK
jgi:predicted peptidase